MFAGKRHDAFIRLIAFWCSYAHLHTDFQTADDQRICHIVAITDITHLQSFQYTVFFPNGHQIRKHLARMTEIGQPIDDRDRTVFGQILYFFLIEGADHDAVQITGQHSCRILHWLASADLQVTAGEEQRLHAQLERAGLKGDTRTCA